MNVFYWKGAKNFGDLLSELLLKRFAFIDAKHSPADQADIVLVGSILEKIPKDYQGIVAGCGFLHEKSNYISPAAKVLGVRGPLTARHVKGTPCLGDPGLLADELVGYHEKEYDLGIIPHWTDKTLAVNPTFKNFKPLIINVADDPLTVIRQIAKCKKIVSSSLHGVILADAFGIPRRIEMAPRMLSHVSVEGGYHKWLDYSASLGMVLEIGKTQEAPFHKVVERQHELFDMFEEIRSLSK